MAKINLTAERLRCSLDYHENDGVFHWLLSKGRTSKQGDVAGYENGGYIKIMIDGRSYQAHRLAFLYMTGKWPSEDVDHINGCRTDNRWINLRDVPHSINTENRHRASISNKVGLLGVSMHHRSARFRARIRTDGKLIQLGWFDTPEEAHAAYLNAKREIHVGCTI